jgi:hypothetical protein
MQEYLPETTDYLTRFFAAKYPEYFEGMKELRPSKGYGYYYRHEDVTQFIRNIVHNISEQFNDLRIPECYPSPEHLVQTLLKFKEMLENQNIIFDDVFKHYQNTTMIPIPVTVIHNVNNEVLSAIKHVLTFDENKKYLDKESIVINKRLAFNKLLPLFKKFGFASPVRGKKWWIRTLVGTGGIGALLVPIFTHPNATPPTPSVPSASQTSSSINNQNNINITVQTQPAVPAKPTTAPTISHQSSHNEGSYNGRKTLETTNQKEANDPTKNTTEVTIHHQGNIELYVVDKNGVYQPLQEVYVSCAQGITNIKLHGETRSNVSINNCQKLSVNASLLGSERWLSDVWHKENQGQPLVLSDYKIVVNGISLGKEYVTQQGENANYQVKLLMQ